MSEVFSEMQVLNSRAVFHRVSQYRGFQSSDNNFDFTVSVRAASHRPPNLILLSIRLPVHMDQDKDDHPRTKMWVVAKEANFSLRDGVGVSV